MCSRTARRYICGHVVRSPIHYCSASRARARRERRNPRTCGTMRTTEVQDDTTYCPGSACRISRMQGSGWTCHRCRQIDNRGWNCMGPPAGPFATCGHQICAARCTFTTAAERAANAWDGLALNRNWWAIRGKQILFHSTQFMTNEFHS